MSASGRARADRRSAAASGNTLSRRIVRHFAQPGAVAGGDVFTSPARQGPGGSACARRAGHRHRARLGGGDLWHTLSPTEVGFQEGLWGLKGRIRYVYRPHFLQYRSCGALSRVIRVPISFFQ